MIYDDIRVPMPEKRMHFKKGKNGSLYAYYTIKAYRNAAGKPTSKVRAIGKKDIETGLLIPNSSYFELFPSEQNGSTLKTESKLKTHIQKTGGSVLISQPVGVKTVGTPVVFMELARQTKLLETLQTSFPDKWDKILLTAFYMFSEGNVMAYIDDWCNETRIDFTNSLYDVACSRLFESISHEERQDFFAEWISRNDEQLFNDYDVSSISTYSPNIDIAEWGYNRDHEKLPQINFGMFYGATSCLPIYYDIYNGSVPDTACLEYMMINAKDIGIKDVNFVIDCGFMSEDNLNFMVQNQYSFITAMSTSRTDAKELIDENLNIMNKYQNFIGKHGVYGVKCPLNLYGLKVTAHVYFSSKRHVYEESDIISKIDKLEQELKKLNKKHKLSKRFTDYFTIEAQQPASQINYTVDPDKVNKKLKRAGYFILLSSDDKLTSEEVLTIYRNKDIIEKNFDQFKNHLDFKRVKTHNINTTEGKMFVGFIALILRAQLHNKLKNVKEPKGLHPEKVLRELKKIKATVMRSGDETLHPVTKTQTTILEVLGVKKEMLGLR
jgi:transposase